MSAPIKEGREILARVMAALVDAPECYIPVRGPWLPLTDAQQANWEARQTIGRLLREGSAEFKDVSAADCSECETGICAAHDNGTDFEPTPAQSFEQDLEETSERARIEAKQAQLFS